MKEKLAGFLTMACQQELFPCGLEHVKGKLCTYFGKKSNVAQHQTMKTLKKESKCCNKSEYTCNVAR